MRPTRGQHRQAATTVEFALVSLVFFTIVLGIIELGRGLMVDYLLRHTARQACRVAVPAGRSNTDVQAEVDAALKRNGLPDTEATVKVNGTVADVGTAKSGDLITVEVSLPLGQVTWVPGSHYLGGSLGGTYSLRRE